MSRLIQYINEEDADQLRKWGESFGKNHGKGPKDHGFFDLCVSHMKDHISDPEAYCARVKDAAYGSTHWRGKGKSDKEVKKDVKDNQNYPDKGKEK